jgi:glutamyl-tRNA reductase
MKRELPLTLIGISYKTASIEIREAVAFSKEEQDFLIRQLINLFNLKGIMIISTCNRTEIYLSGELTATEITAIRKWLNEYKNCEYFTDDCYFYVFRGKEVVTHFFQVISGLDSQIVGEPQITGQVKEAYRLAYNCGGTDTFLNKLINYGLQAQKKVRRETFLSEGAVSVSYAAVELARKIFTELNKRSVMLIGAGETAELAAQHFREKGVGRILVVNRTLDKAQSLAAKFSGEAYTLDNLPALLAKVDIVLSATSSQGYILTREMIEKFQKNRPYNPLFLIDLAIPRDIDPAVDHLDSIYLYNLDDLEEIVHTNLAKRHQELPRARKIILQSVESFAQWVSTHASSHIINHLSLYFENLRKHELKRLRSRLPHEEMPQIEYLTESLMKKILHQHIRLLRATVKKPQLYQQYLNFLSDLYEFEKK